MLGKFLISAYLKRGERTVSFRECFLAVTKGPMENKIKVDATFVAIGACFALKSGLFALVSYKMTHRCGFQGRAVKLQGCSEKNTDVTLKATGE